jgi:hypothetical protein
MGVFAYRQHPSQLWAAEGSLSRARRRHSCKCHLTARAVVFAGFIEFVIQKAMVICGAHSVCQNLMVEVR